MPHKSFLAIVTWLKFRKRVPRYIKPNRAILTGRFYHDHAPPYGPAPSDKTEKYRKKLPEAYEGVYYE